MHICFSIFFFSVWYVIPSHLHTDITDLLYEIHHANTHIHTYAVPNVLTLVLRKEKRGGRVGNRFQDSIKFVMGRYNYTGRR